LEARQAFRDVNVFGGVINTIANGFTLPLFIIYEFGRDKWAISIIAIMWGEFEKGNRSILG
jgi:hypothetical protein